MFIDQFGSSCQARVDDGERWPQCPNGATGTWSGGSTGSGTCTPPTSCTNSAETVHKLCPETYGGFAAAPGGTAFSQDLTFQVANWASMGGRPVDWEKYAVMYDDVATQPFAGANSDTSADTKWRSRLARGTFDRANNSGTLVIGAGVLELTINLPGNIGGGFVINASSISQILINDVYSASDAPISILNGHVNLAGGTNMGPGAIDISTSGRVVVSDMDNYGQVKFASGQKYFLLATDNRASGAVTVTNAGGTIYMCTNYGTITVTGSTGVLDSVSNANGGVITISDSTAELRNATNAGGIVVNGGTLTISGSLLTNAAGGTITVNAGTSVPTVSVSGGVNLGTVTINAGTIGLSLDRNDGQIVIASGVTCTSLNFGAGSTVTTVTGAGAGVNGCSVTLPAASPSPVYPYPPPPASSGSSSSPPPASSPSPPPPAQITTTFTADGDVSTYTTTVQDSMKDVIANAANVTADKVGLSITAGSVVITVTIEVPATVAAQTSTSLSTGAGIFASPTNLQGALTSGGVTAVTVGAITAAPTVTAASPSPSSSSSDDGLSTGALVGIIVGALAGVVLIAVVVMMVMKKKGSKPYVQPAA